MGLLDRLRGKRKETTMEVVLIEDPQLVYRIDAWWNDEWSGDTKDHPDVCRSCGRIDPGFRYCKRCGAERRPRTKKGEIRCWFQEVAGESHYQDAFEGLIVDAPRRKDGGVREWVTAVLVPEPQNKHDKNAVQVQALRDGEPAAVVGYLPAGDAASYQKAALKVYSDYECLVACRGLVQGGFDTHEGGRAATFGMRLLLPLPGRLKAAADGAKR